ncbi:CsbD family protein [Rheinheimera gaetbuli]
MNKFSEQSKDKHSNKASSGDMTNKVDAAKPKGQSAAKTLQLTPLPGAKGKWPQQVKAAKNQWGKLSEAEILKSDGNPQQLSGLVQQRYDIGRDIADKQVKTFLDKCNLA